MIEVMVGALPAGLQGMLALASDMRQARVNVTHIIGRRVTRVRAREVCAGKCQLSLKSQQYFYYGGKR